MLSVNDIINVSFRKAGFSGYRTEDVDHFIDQVKESFDALTKTNLDQKEQYERLKTENGQLTEKIKILAQKVEDYRTEEDEIKNALISAQKLGDASVRESRHKAEIIIKDANLKAERIIAGADQEIASQKKEMERLQQAVADFRAKLLNTYKEHLTLIDALPSQKPEEPVQAPEKSDVPAEKAPEREIPGPTVPQEEEPAQEEADPQFHAEVSNFDDAFESVPGRYTAIQFGNEPDLSGDAKAPDGV